MGQPLDINLPPDELKKAIAEALNNKMDYGVFYQNPKYPNRRNWQGEFEVKVGNSVSIKWNPKLKEGYIDIEGAPGKNMKDLFSDFDKVRDGLPEGKFLMSPGEAKDAAGNVVGRKALKHKLYAREFKNDPQIMLNEDLNLRNRPGGSQESFTLDTTKPRDIKPQSLEDIVSNIEDTINKNKQEAIDTIEGFEKRLKNKKLTTADSKFLRRNVPTEFTGPDGQVYQTAKVSQFSKGQVKHISTPIKKGSSTDSARSVYEDVPGATTKNPDANPATFLRREGRTKEFYNAISDLAYDDTQIEKYMYEVGVENNKLRRLVQRMNKFLPEGQKVSIGHLQPVSKTINAPFNRFLELLEPNKAKGNRYQLSEAGQIAIGNPAKPGASWLENWKRDFLVWADRPENGGSGILPQRGDYSSLMEQKFSELSGIHFDKLSPEDQLKAVNDIEDLLGDLEGRNQWTITQAKQKKIWGILSESDAKQATEFFNDNELAAEIKAERLKVDVLDTGRRLGGIGDTFKIARRALYGTILNVGKAVAGPEDFLTSEMGTNVAQIEQRLKAGENAGTVLKEEGLDIAQDFSGQLKGTAGIMAAFKLASAYAPQATAAGGTVLGGLAWPAAIIGGYGMTNAYLKEKTGRSLNERVLMDTGYADTLNTERVVNQEVGDDGVSREVVTYEKTQEAKDAKREAFKPLLKDSDEDDKYKPGDWYQNEEGDYFIYQDFGQFTKSRSKGAGELVTP